MAKSFENVEDILADWVNEDAEKSLEEAVDKFQKQDQEEKNTFLCRKLLELEESQSSTTKGDTKCFFIL